MREKNIYRGKNRTVGVEMTTIVVKKEREGCKIFPLKRQKNTDQGELVPPGIRFFSGKGDEFPSFI